MRLLIWMDRNGEVRIDKYYPVGGAVPSGIQPVPPGTGLMIDVRPGEVFELQREWVDDDPEDRFPVVITKAQFDEMLQDAGDPASKVFSKVESHFYGVRA